MFLVPIVKIVVIIGSVFLTEWVAPSYVYIDIVLDGSITKLQ